MVETSTVNGHSLLREKTDPGGRGVSGWRIAGYDRPPRLGDGEVGVGRDR